MSSLAKKFGKRASFVAGALQTGHSGLLAKHVVIQVKQKLWPHLDINGSVKTCKQIGQRRVLSKTGLVLDLIAREEVEEAVEEGVVELVLLLSPIELKLKLKLGLKLGFGFEFGFELELEWELLELELGLELENWVAFSNCVPFKDGSPDTPELEW